MSTENPETKSQASDKSIETTEKSHFKLSEGLILAIISTGSYLLTFQYEKGYASYFGIPVSFINLNLTNILYIAAIIMGFVLIAFPFANALTVLLFSSLIRNPMIFNKLVLLLVLAFASFFPAYFIGTWLVWLIALIIFLMYASIAVIIPLIVHRKKGGYLTRLEAQEEIDNSFINLYDLMALKFGRLGMLLMLLFIVSVSYASTAGYGAASNQEEYLVGHSTPEMVLLRTYGDNLIFAPFDRNTKEVQKRFVVVKVAEDPKLILSLEKIGPLKPIEPKPVLLPSPEPAPSGTTSPEQTGLPVQK